MMRKFQHIFESEIKWKEFGMIIVCIEFASKNIFVWFIYFIFRIIVTENSQLN